MTAIGSDRNLKDSPAVTDMHSYDTNVANVYFAKCCYHSFVATAHLVTKIVSHECKSI